MNECIGQRSSSCIRSRIILVTCWRRKLTLEAAGVDISKIEWPEVPEPGTLDLMRIMDSLYAFS